MQGIIRVDASVAIGVGHLSRCMVLKALLEERGAKISLLMDRCGRGFIDETHNEVLWLDDAINPQDTIAAIERNRLKPGFLIVDHYDLDVFWEKSLRPHVKKIMVIDDLANRSHDCDILLDQNLFPASGERYRGLIAPDCATFFGPGYALLRPEFFLERRRLRERSGAVKHILVNFGGSDPAGITLKALKGVLNALGNAIEVVCVAGRANQHAAEIEAFCRSQSNVPYYLHSDQMAMLMHQADLAIGAGGSSAWERCFLGLPSLVAIIAENQRCVTEQLASVGVLKNMGSAAELDEKSFSQAVLNISEQTKLLENMGLTGLEIMGDSSERRYEKMLTCIMGKAQ